jgi:hypothetical protein
MKKLPYIIVAIAMILMAFVILHLNNQVNSLTMDTKGIASLKAENALLAKEWKAKDTTIKVQQQVIADQKGQLYEIAKRNSQLKKINSQVRASLETTIDSVFIPYDRPDSGMVADSILKFHKEDPEGWYKIAGEVHNNGVLIDSLKLVSDVQVTIGFAKPPGIKNFFKKKLPVVEVVSNSPYVKITGVSNVNFVKEKCVTCKYKYIVTGVILGSLLTHFVFH